MRMVTYRSRKGPRAGIQTERGTIDAAELLGIESASVRELIAGERISELRERIDGGVPDNVPAP